MGLFSRLFGICRTKPPADPGCWTLSDGRLELDLARTPELSARAGAVRLEGGGLPVRVLVFRGEDDALYAFVNVCPHARRRLDPVPDASTVECCSVGRSRFDYEGQRLSGMAKDPVTPLEVTEEEDKVVVALP